MSQTASSEKESFYHDLVQQLKSLLDKELPLISNFSNASSLLFWALNDGQRQVNWTGFYFYNETTRKLTLGPFQGRVACTTIPLGKGVCGTAVQEKASVVVENVHLFPGHIACDSASESEIVVPIILSDGSIFGVLDVDSLVTSQFDAADRKGMEEFVKVMVESLSLHPNHSSTVLR